MSPKAEEEILSNLANENPELGENLRELLFTTTDILNADDKFIQNKLRDMTDLDVAFLIAGKGKEFRDKILGNVSSTRKNQILETEDLKKPMRRSDCEKITSQFFSDLRRAYEDGELYIKGRDEDYV
jgi:flagellar motor switch protein FliG